MAKGSPIKKPAVKAPRAVPVNLDEEIKAKAFEIFAERVARGEAGDETGDWLKAEAEVKRKHGL
jgi:hypothetical protein